jgi:acetyl-CoA carboxylase carboxyl transferase subunit alpha
MRQMAKADHENLVQDIERIQKKLDRKIQQIYGQLSAFQTMQVARHPDRPHFIDYYHALFSDMFPLSGDRAFQDDPSIRASIARIGAHRVMVIGQEKGRTTEERVAHHFGMPYPEGYRKVSRLMRLADKFSLPILFFIDTPGAYPGVEAENRGQSEAIARAIYDTSQVNVPTLSIVIGEGGSGGAVALGTTNTTTMLQYAIYSVISPEGCSSILWRTIDETETAAAALQIQSSDVKKNGLIDDIIEEPVGGAHRNPDAAIRNVETYIQSWLDQQDWTMDFQKERAQKFMKIGLV